MTVVERPPNKTLNSSGMPPSKGSPRFWDNKLVNCTSVGKLTLPNPGDNRLPVPGGPKGLLPDEPKGLLPGLLKPPLDSGKDGRKGFMKPLEFGDLLGKDPPLSPPKNEF